MADPQQRSARESFGASELPDDGEALDSTRSETATGDTLPSSRRHRREMEDLSGRSALGYTFIKKLGAGGNCSVYEALCSERRRLVALKVLHRHIASCDVTAQRFAREIEAVKLIDHDSVIDILDAGVLPDGRAFYAMERFDGVSLSQLVRRRGGLSADDSYAILSQICAGLRAAHDMGIVHRDIKPGNVLVGRGPDGLRVKIIDFGIAKILRPDAEAGLTADHVRVGSPVAMAPEQILGEPVDARTDIYALGVLGFYIVTGRYPFRSDGEAPIERYHLLTPPPHAAAIAPVPAALDEVLFRCMAKEPDARYAGVAELEQALERCASSPTSAAAARELKVVAVHLEVMLGELPGDPDESPDESADDGDTSAEDDAELLRDMDDILDAGMIALSAAGLAIHRSTGNSLLAIKLLDGESESQTVERRGVIDAAEKLYRSLLERPDAHRDATLRICTTSGTAPVEERDGQKTIADGPIARAAWLPTTRAAGFFLIENEPAEPS